MKANAAIAPPSQRRGACPGLAAPMPTGDGLLVRLACAGTTMGLDAAAALYAAARRYGNGIVEVTARGSIQVRGLSAASAPAFAETVAPLGIDAGDGVAILIDPLAGLEPAPAVDARVLAGVVRSRLAGASFAAALGPKVSIVIDGGRALHLDAVRADIRLRAAGTRWQVALGGDATTAMPIGLVADAAEAAMRLLEMIARHGPQARAHDLIRSQEADALRAAIANLLIDVPGPGVQGADATREGAAGNSPPPCGEGLGVGVARCGTSEQYGTTPLPIPPPQGGRESAAAPPQPDSAPVLPRPAAEPIGTHALASERFALGIALAFGHTDADALDDLIEAARRAGADGLRTAAGRAMLVIGLAADALQPLAADAARLGFITRRDDPRRNVVACAGAPICASAEIAARSLAPSISAAAAPLLDGSLTIHLSGCPKGCAHPGAAALTIVGRPSGCDLIVGGSARGEPSAGIATESLPAGLARIAAEVARLRQPAETSADTLARLGAERVAAIFGARPHG
ncbi:MAG TPA: precorrin-3B synthase [Xanthobacteraceae bacterium]